MPLFFVWECNILSLSFPTSVGKKKKNSPKQVSFVTRRFNSFQLKSASGWKATTSSKAERKKLQIVFDRNKGEKGASTLKINHWINSLDII